MNYLNYIYLQKQANGMKKIGEEEYTQILAILDSLMTKGSENVSKEELKEIRYLAKLAQAYEQSTMFQAP